MMTFKFTPTRTCLSSRSVVIHPHCVAITCFRYRKVSTTTSANVGKPVASSSLSAATRKATQSPSNAFAKPKSSSRTGKDPTQSSLSKSPNTKPASSTAAGAVIKDGPPASSQQDKGADDSEQLAAIEQLMSLSHNYPTLDPWGQAMHTLDVQIPYAVSINALRGAGWATVWSRVKANILDNLKNAASMYRMAAADSFPGVDLSRSGRIDRLFRWLPRLFQCRSIKSGQWIAGIRTQAFDTYRAINKAVSAQDSKTLKRLTLGSYQDSTMRLLRKRTGSDTYVWRLHDSDSPSARVLSLRATEGYLARDEPKLGNRLVVHALVKFDTKQSLQIFSNKGELLSSQQPKRVVEYLVLEKRMWYSSPWMIREQIYETPGVHV